MLRDDLARHLDQLLDASRVKDYCPNGLQVEGRAEIGPRSPRMSACRSVVSPS
jgi:putative NIF3 family GTP cyclohydrolase 1 type 2